MTIDIRNQVIKEIAEVFSAEGVEFDESMLSRPVMEIGVDSLAYAILVARLEQKFGQDPFTTNPELGYPELLEDFVKAYEDGS